LIKNAGRSKVSVLDSQILRSRLIRSISPSHLFQTGELLLYGLPQ
jgi:hypothetical protein